MLQANSEPCCDQNTGLEQIPIYISLVRKARKSGGLQPSKKTERTCARLITNCKFLLPWVPSVCQMACSCSSGCEPLWHLICLCIRDASRGHSKKVKRRGEASEENDAAPTILEHYIARGCSVWESLVSIVLLLRHYAACYSCASSSCSPSTSHSNRCNINGCCYYSEPQFDSFMES